ncbi:hypothetical protein ACS0TY_018639 [Phlomoides rotata]
MARAHIPHHLARDWRGNCRPEMTRANEGNPALTKSLAADSFFCSDSLQALEYIAEKDDIGCQNSFPSLGDVQLWNLPNLKGLFEEEELGEMFPNLVSLKTPWRVFVISRVCGSEEQRSSVCQKNGFETYILLQSLGYIIARYGVVYPKGGCGISFHSRNYIYV